MATKKEETSVKKESPVLKKRTAPSDKAKDTPSSEKKAMPLKKREVPTETSIENKTASSALKKRELPTDVKPEEKKASSMESLFGKKVVDEDNKQQSKEKSSLDKMRERIAAQKKLEQDMMTKQSLRNQEKAGIRGKLSALSKDIEEDEEISTSKVKPNIDFDLKSEALEIQNKKLKQDLEKSKQQLQALLAIEFYNMKVLDPNSLTLSNDFVEAVNNIKDQVEASKNNEEQTLKDELSSLQKELSSLKAKNEAAKKASEDAQRVATQAQRAIKQAKKAIEEQENDQTRDFKKEIADLEKQVSNKEKELVSLQNEKAALKDSYELQLKELKTNLEGQVKDLNKDIKAKEKQIEKLNDAKEALSLDKKNTLAENKKLAGQIEELLSKVSTLEQNNSQAESLQLQLDAKDKEWQEKIDKEIEIANKQINELECKIKELEEKGSNYDELTKEKQQLEAKFEEQAKKIDELLMNYQSQLDEKDQEINNLRQEVLEKQKEIASLPEQSQLNELQEKHDNLVLSETKLNQENQLLKEKYDDLVLSETKLNQENQLLKEKYDNLALSETKLNQEIQLLKEKVALQEQYKPVSNDKELLEKCEQYQALLVSERNSHLKVEQKLCKDLDDYKEEIEKLQAQITNMSSNHGLTRLNQQVDVIEKYINELKENSQINVNRDVYNDYYEKLIEDYKQEQERFIAEIERRNKMLGLLRDEKVNIVQILKKSGKNTSVIEKQIEDINSVINSVIHKTDVVKTEEIEKEILNSIKEDLLKYCENVKQQAVKDIEEINNKYDNATSVSSLIKVYNTDCDTMTRSYGNEIAKLNLERELNKDHNKINAIEEKILMVEKQYKALTAERDRKFNEAMSKLRTQGYNILTNDYFAFVGEEYVNSLNQYAEMKKKIESQIAAQKESYQAAMISLKEQEQELLRENNSIKEEIANLNANESITNEVNVLKQELLIRLQSNEVKLQNLVDYGFNSLEEDNKVVLEQLENEYKNIVEEEKKLKELYAQRETEAKNRLEMEKAKEAEVEKEKVQQSISDYIYIQEETERIIESVQEKRDRLQAEVEIEEEPIIDNSIEEVENTVEEEIEIQKPVLEEHIIVSNVEEKERLSRIRIEDNLDQKDLPRIKQLQDEITELKYNIAQNNEVEDQLREQYERFVVGEKQMASELKDVKKYNSLLSEYKIVKAETTKLGHEVALMDPKQDKKSYKARNAELRSMEHKTDYIAKHIKALNKNKHVIEYVKLIGKIKEFENSFAEIEKRNDELQLQIKQKEIELETLKA